jgi:hypothetical protein
MLTVARTFMFCSKQNVRLFAFTRDATGSNLPGSHGPWLTSTCCAMQTKADEAEVAGAVVSSIERRGFYLSRSDGNAW